MSSQFALLKARRFGPFFGTQFLGAFNDNLFKNALVVLLTFQAAQWTTLKPELLANLAAGIFILPFFLFSATAGQLADKYDKAFLARVVKVLEIAIMLIAGVGFWLHSLGVLLFCLLQTSWILWGDSYRVVFRAMAAISLGRGDERQELSHEPVKTARGDTRVVIVNRSLMAAGGLAMEPARPGQKRSWRLMARDRFPAPVRWQSAMPSAWRCDRARFGPGG